ncbi:MAG TPA: MFS transporter [Methylomirabilota bacterium]
MIFYGWRIVAGAFLVLFTAYGAQYSFGVFFAALIDEFGWSRAGLAGVFSLYAAAYSVFAFPAGRLTDRWGPRAVITAGGLFLGVALAAMAAVTQLWQPYVLYGLVAAIGMGTAYVPCSGTVVKWFARRRGLAVGLAGSGGSVGTFALPPLAQWLVGAVGWRAAYVVFGAAVLVTLATVARVMRRDPESMGLHPDGAPAPPSAVVPGVPLGIALRAPALWLLGLALTATWIPVFVPLVHLVSLARDLGHGPAAGAWLVSALGAGAVAGRLTMGPISDRLGRKPALVFGTAAQAVAFIAYAYVAGIEALVATTVAFGYSYGAVSTLFPAAVADLFGRSAAGAIVGFLFMSAGSMAAWGPVAAGAIYDAYGSYAPAFELSAACNLIAAVVVAMTRMPAR